MTKHYVEFLFPGSFFPETDEVEIESRESKFEIPATCFGYSFFDVETVEVNGETLTGEPKNKSPRVLFGEVFDEERVAREVPDSRILLSNMRNNNLTIVRTRCGNFQPLREGDTVIYAPLLTELPL